ncbi:MAG: hypothetical protein PVSMB11_11180 [Desulfuromonadaceae bacterium]
MTHGRDDLWSRQLERLVRDALSINLTFELYSRKKKLNSLLFYFAIGIV